MIARNRDKSRDKAALGDTESTGGDGFGDRLSWLLDRFDSRGEAAEVAGVGADQLAKYVRGGAQPSLQVMARLCLKQGVSIDWLWTGNGRRDEGTPPPSPDSVRVLMFDIRAGAGSGQAAENEEPIGVSYLPRQLLEGHGINPAGAEMGNVDGDSMQPMMFDGEPIVWDRTDKRLRDKVFLMRRGGRLVVKKVQVKSDGSIVLKSENPDYDPETLPRDEADELEVIGRVGMVLRSI